MEDMHTHHSEEMKVIHEKANNAVGKLKKSPDNHFYGHFAPQGLTKGINTTVIHHKSGGY